MDEVDRTIELKFDQWSGDTGNIEFINVTVRDKPGGIQKGKTIEVGKVSSTGEISIPGNTTWVVEWKIKWEAGALSSNTVSVQLTLIVKGE